MPVIKVSPNIEEISRNTERDMRTFIDDLCEKARNGVRASFDEARRELDHREEQDQLYLLKRELHNRTVEN